jgi:DNA-binding MarR family transcriptional regulator
MRALGLKRGWIGVLVETLAKPGQSQDALCRSLRVDRAATARSVFELESLGYVERRGAPGDRRQKLVHPTQKTLDLSDALFGVLAKHNEALFKGFDQARREEALLLLAGMAENLTSALDNEEK